jgi:SAM-dependent methyltransferase
MAFDRHAFWRDPASSEYEVLISGCRPEYYLDLDNITNMVVSCMQKYVIGPENSILEIGCGTGRNLVGLVKAGYKNVSGVEISEKAVAVGRERFPEYKDIGVTIAPIEEIIESLPQYDVIYTQGCLMHLPYSLDWVIEEIKRRSRYLILTNEGEPRSNIHVWWRNYEEYITSGEDWMQLEMESGLLYPPLPDTTIKRVFMRRVRDECTVQK